jgi:hypothetical protein
MQEDQYIRVPKDMFLRMSRALIGIEKVLQDKEDNSSNWITEEKALELLGCSKRQLYRIKGSQIKYKATGRKHQYDRKSIDKYNSLMSV